MNVRNVSSLVRASVLAIFVLGCLAMVRAADEPVDMQRVREARARLQKGETLTPEEQAYYDSGIAEYQRQRKGKETSSNSKAKAPQKDDAASQGKRAEEAFTLSEEISPLESFEVTSPAGVKVVGILRKPPGKGPFPALIHLHGGLKTLGMDELRQFATQRTASRFVAAGYLAVIPTVRERATDPQTRNVLDDCLTVIDWVKHRSDVDPKSVVAWGFSAGGSSALELAGETDLAAVVAEEPATILMIGTMKKLSDKNPVQISPKRYWTPELQAFTREKIRKIHCPVFIAYGEPSNTNTVNDEIVIPELKAAGKQLKTKYYPGEYHGFSRHLKEFFDDAFAFFGKSIATAPRPISQP